MNKYELAVVVSAKLEDEARADVIEKVKAMITRFGGNVTDVDEWGKRRFAYADKEVNRVYLALDATDRVIERAIEAGADMLITHHPLLFSAVKKVTDEDFITRRIVKLIQNDISYYAMHTNYDVLGMAELAGKVLDIAHTDVLDVTQTDEAGEEKGIGRIGELPETMTLEECCVYVKHKLELGSLKVFGDMNRP